MVGRRIHLGNTRNSKRRERKMPKSLEELLRDHKALKEKLAKRLNNLKEAAKMLRAEEEKRKAQQKEKTSQVSPRHDAGPQTLPSRGGQEEPSGEHLAQENRPAQAMHEDDDTVNKGPTWNERLVMVERLPNGKLRVPWGSSITDQETGETIMLDGVEEIGPEHPDYQEWIDYIKRNPNQVEDVEK
jgi:hypothetical protein